MATAYHQQQQQQQLRQQPTTTASSSDRWNLWLTTTATATTKPAPPPPQQQQPQPQQRTMMMSSTSATASAGSSSSLGPSSPSSSSCHTTMKSRHYSSSSSSSMYVQQRPQHAGQLRYHDFHKLREAHAARMMMMARTRTMMMASRTTTSTMGAAAMAAAATQPSSSSSIALLHNNASFVLAGTTHPTRMSQPPMQFGGASSSAHSHHHQQQQHQQQSRTFWTNAVARTSSATTSSRNPFTHAYNQLSIKLIEQQANAAPGDANAQYRLLSELQMKGYDDAVVQRIQHPAFRHYAINVPCAIIYLESLQRLPPNAVQSFDANTLLSRLAATSEGSEATDQFNELKTQLQQKKSNKRDQVAFLLNQLLSGAGMGAGSLAGAAGSAPFGAALTNRGGGGMAMVPGTTSRNPLHVVMGNGTGGGGGGGGGGSGSVRTALIGFVARAGLVLIAFAALGAVLDERGLGGRAGTGPGGGAGGMGSAMSGSKHIQEAGDETKVKFADVKGVEEAKAELEEIVLYLKDPSKFTRLGGKLPRGLLLTGPPGTGKTLLAKAIAGEAEVPFFYSSGSQFEEVYVGLGAKRIRELFEAAKKKAPAIIFIDEIDAVGGTRKLKDQSALKMTLNELLVQLDGFDENNGIIVIGATNFVESLDAALLRPGRFDKHVTVPLPDVGGRKEILEMYAKKTRLAKDVDLNVLARGTTGFSGADLFNLMNQAALKASVDGLPAITMQVFEYAKDKILMGAERKSAVISRDTAKCTAYHEAGHALVAVLTEGADPIHKATIMPRGQSLGMVTTLPEGDQTSRSHRQMIAFMDVCMGGRVAEELIFGPDAVTSGASSDIQTATSIARNMVTKFGFSDAIGVVFHGGRTGEESASDETRALIDQEVKRLTDSAYERARQLLTKHAAQHKLLAETLLEYETLTGDEVRELVTKGRKPQRPVMNKNGGEKGDQSSLGGGSGKKNKKADEDDTKSTNDDDTAEAKKKKKKKGGFGGGFFGRRGNSSNGSVSPEEETE